MDIKAYKMDGLGNDFVIIDQRDKIIEFSKEEIIKICDRKFIGCDQLIVIKKNKELDASLEFFNSDGSISGACGNGTRCAAYLLSKEYTFVFNAINFLTKFKPVPPWPPVTTAILFLNSNYFNSWTISISVPSGALQNVSFTDLSLEKIGYGVKRRQIRPRAIGKRQKVSQDEAINFAKENFGIIVEE